MKKIFAVALIAAASSAVFAQNKDFLGASAGFNVEFKSTTVKFDDFSGLGKQNMIGSLSGDYGIGWDNDKVVLVGGKWDMGNTTIAEIGPVKLSEKRHYSVFVAPGVVLSNKTLAYGKLSYHSAKGYIEAGSEELSDSIKGIGYGVGIRTHLSGNWYLNVEAGKVSYSDKDIGSAKATTGTTYGLVGFSYKF